MDRGEGESASKSLTVKEEIFARLSRSGKIKKLLVTLTDLLLAATVVNIDTIYLPWSHEPVYPRNLVIVGFNGRDLFAPCWESESFGGTILMREVRDLVFREVTEKSRLPKVLVGNVVIDETLNSEFVSNSRKRIRGSGNFRCRTLSSRTRTTLLLLHVIVFTT
jgi:hypothetical protein